MAKIAIALLLALPLSLAASPALAQTEDPRDCLFRRVPQEHAKLLENVRLKEFPGEPARGLTVPEDPYRAAAAKRCVESEGWPLAYAESAADLLYGEARAQVIGPRLKQLGYDLARLDSHIGGLSAKQQNHLKWLGPNDRDFAAVFGELAGLVSPVPRDPAHKDMLLRYIKGRAEADRAVQIFAAFRQIDSSKYLSQDWQVLPALEAARPVIRERMLTREERSEMSRLRGSYFGPVQKGGRTLPQLQRLLELAQSGDREAMTLARDALAKGMPIDLYREYSDLGINTLSFGLLTERLAAMWTAMLWQRHGYDEASRRFMKACVGGLYGEVHKHEKDGVASILGPDGIVHAVNSQGIRMDETADGCGFTLLGVPAARAPKGATVLQFYDKRGSFAALGNRTQSGDFAITGVRFNPIVGDAAFTARKFAAHVELRRRGLLYDSRTGDRTFGTPTLVVSYPWYEHYAALTGQLHLLKAADAAGNAAIAARLREQAKAQLSRWSSALAAFKASPYSINAREALMYSASELGGSYWQEYKRLVPDPVYAANNPAQMVGTGTGSSGYREVEVRSYDSNGTYTGSSRVSAAWADIMKMTSARKP